MGLREGALVGLEEVGRAVGYDVGCLDGFDGLMVGLVVGLRLGMMVGTGVGR